MRADTMKEEWKAFADGYYEASTLGRIRRARPGHGTWIGRVLVTSPSPSKKARYCKATLAIGAITTVMRVHVVIAELFLGPRPPGLEVNHKDGNKLNNSVANLEYVSRADNVRHAYRLGLCPRERNGRLRKSVVDRICTMRQQGATYRAIANATGVSLGHCYHLSNGISRGTYYTTIYQP